MPLPLKFSQSLQAATALGFAPRIEEAKMPTHLVCQLRPGKVPRLLEQAANRGNRLGIRKRPFNLFLSFHAATLHGMGNHVQLYFRV